MYNSNALSMDWCFSNIYLVERPFSTDVYNDDAWYCIMSDRNFPPRKSPPLCTPPVFCPSCEICRLREAVPTRVPNPNASEACYKPEQRRRGSIPPELKNPRRGNFRRGKNRGETQGWKLPGGGKCPSTI